MQCVLIAVRSDFLEPLLTTWQVEKTNLVPSAFSLHAKLG